MNNYTGMPIASGYGAMGNVWNRAGMQQLPHYEAPLLHGQQDANMFPMGPGSEIYLPDADNDILWWIRTDQMGTRQVIPLDINIHKEKEPIDMNDVLTRLTNLEEKVYAKSNKPNAKRPAATTASDVVATIDTTTIK